MGLKHYSAAVQVLTAGVDGQLHLLPMDWEAAQTSTSDTCYSNLGSSVSYHSAHWASIDTFVTASTTGEEHVMFIPMCILMCKVTGSKASLCAVLNVKLPLTVQCTDEKCACVQHSQHRTIS